MIHEILPEGHRPRNNVTVIIRGGVKGVHMCTVTTMDVVGKAAKCKRKKKPKRFGRKERLKTQLESVKDEKKAVCHQLTLLTKKNQSLLRFG